MLPDELLNISRFVFPSSAVRASGNSLVAQEPTITEVNKHNIADTVITIMNLSEVAGKDTQSVLLMPIAYEKDVQHINEELEKELNGLKPRKLISTERLKARRVIVHDKGDYAEAEQIKRNVS